jgi:methylaspartate mutase sigma subunit
MPKRGDCPGQEETEFMSNSRKRKPVLVLGVIGHDVHIIGVRLLEIAFREAGFDAVNLGISVSIDEFIEAAIEVDADAILVSSLYGHGELDCQGFREKCVEAGIGDILLFAGGNLASGIREWTKMRQTFIDMGFTNAYPPGLTPNEAVAEITAELSGRGIVPRTDAAELPAMKETDVEAR